MTYLPPPPHTTNSFKGCGGKFMICPHCRVGGSVSLTYPPPTHTHTHKPHTQHTGAKLRREIQDMSTPLDVELVVVSPLTRTLQTARLTVGRCVNKRREKKIGSRLPTLQTTRVGRCIQKEKTEFPPPRLLFALSRLRGSWSAVLFVYLFLYLFIYLFRNKLVVMSPLCPHSPDCAAHGRQVYLYE